MTSQATDQPQKPAAIHKPESCPVTLALGLIANKWAVLILYTLAQADKATLRFGQIQKSLHNITQRELTKHLREFERAGLVMRVVYPEVPPRVEYVLTELGHSLCEPVNALSRWAEHHASVIQHNRQTFDSRK